MSEEKTKPRNLYKELANDPETLAKRAAKKAHLEGEMRRIIGSMPGRLPDAWPAERIMQMDRFCLDHGKRCIMYDDAGAGFYLMLNWDWLTNQPAQYDTFDQMMEREQGWWQIIHNCLKLPLLDPDVPPEQLAAWVDASTMRIHAGFLDKLHRLRRNEGTKYGVVLEDPYWEQITALDPWVPCPPFVPEPRSFLEQGVYPPPRPASAPAAGNDGGAGLGQGAAAGLAAA